MRLRENSQCAKILARLAQQPGEWVTMPALVEVSGSYNIHSRVDELRHNHGVQIENETDVSVRPHISRYRLIQSQADQARQSSTAATAACSVMAAVLFALGLSFPSNALALDARAAATAIVGEAAGQPFAVKLAVAEAIRHRGTLQGVYGLNAAHNATEPARVWKDARRAWAQSAHTDITHGATHFGNLQDVRKGTFTGLQLTCIVGSGKDATYFFRNRS